MQASAHIHMNRHAMTTNPNGKPSGIYGRKLETGDVLEATDVYDSSSGNWEPCPVPGLALAAGISTVWVRPGE